MNSFRNIKSSFNTWTILSFLIVSGISVPLIFVLSGLFSDGGEMWQHFIDHLLADYVSNTLLLIVFVGLLSIYFGVSSAWVISNYDFPGKSLLSIGLLLPLTIPSYIAAYTYSGIFDYSGIVQTSLRSVFGENSPTIDIMNLPSICLILALVLYPYVYLISKASFQGQSRNMIEAARSLGMNAWQAFVKVALPLSRPAIIGGVSLVLMEVLNDYGAVKYFGVSTFTTGIFRAWFSLGEANLALRMAAILVAIVFVIFFLEKQLRGKQEYQDKGIQTIEGGVQQAKGIQLFLVYFFAGLPFLLGFVVPVVQLSSWAFGKLHLLMENEFWVMAKNSFLLALVAALSCLIVSIIIRFAASIRQNMVNKVLSQFAVIGYAIPGAVIAIGVLIPFTELNSTLISWSKSIFNYNPGLFLSELFIMISFAYVVRFLAVSYNAVDSGYSKLNTSIREASYSLGKNKVFTLFRVEFPVLKWQLLAACILVFIDVLKELPLTLILRPFNYNSLATRTYEYAGDEMLRESSIPALIIILLGVLASIGLNRIIQSK